MSELATGTRTSLRVVRTVRRAESAGGMAARGAEGGGIDPTAITASSLALLTTALTNPYLAGLIAALLVMSITEQFYAPGIGFILPTSSATYADTVKRATYIHIYGVQEGNRIYQYEFGSRSTEIDMRSKYPG